MKHLSLVLGSILVVACTAGAAPPLGPEISGVMTPVNAVIGAAKSDNPGAISALYSDDAVVVDDRQPFEWSGAAAGSRWLTDVSDWTKWSCKVATLRSTPANIQIDNDRAYVVVDARFSSADPKKPWTHDGTLTFTLRKVDGMWKISSQVWTENLRLR